MQKKWKRKIARLSNGNCELNRKALRMKRSWDEVESMLGVFGSGKRKRK